MKQIKKESKPWKYFKITFLILLLLFFINHINIKNGYYEKKINEKTKITSENIKEFEQDIKENKYIDLKKYNQEEYIDSNNLVSKIGYKVSENINIIVKEKTKEIYNFLKKLFS